MKPQPRKRMFTGFGVVLLGILALAIFWRQNFHTVVVSGPSMEPTFTNGDKLLACRAFWLVGDVRVGDVIVVKTENSYIIKRILGLPGDRIDLANIPKTWSIAQGEYSVPAESLYVIGDNATQSEDSRSFGPVKKADVLGKIVMIDPNVFPIVLISLGVLLTVGLVVGIRAAILERRRTGSIV